MAGLGDERPDMKMEEVPDLMKSLQDGIVSALGLTSHCTFDKDKRHLLFPCPTEAGTVLRGLNMKLSVLFSSASVCTVLGTSDLRVPEENNKRVGAIRYAARYNAAQPRVCMELDERDGEVRLRCALPVNPKEAMVVDVTEIIMAVMTQLPSVIGDMHALSKRAGAVTNDYVDALAAESLRRSGLSPAEGRREADACGKRFA